MINCKKVENCFQDSQTYEYQLPVDAAAFLALLDDSWTTRCNYKLRRPVFISERKGVHIKGILAGDIIRVSFPDARSEENKNIFEYWLMDKFEDSKSPSPDRKGTYTKRPTSCKISNLDAWICKSEGIPYLTADILKRLQLDKLNKVLRAKAKEPLTSLAELSALPFATSRMLTESPGQFLLTSQSEISRVISDNTSGTCGSSKRVFYTKKDLDNTVSFFAAGISEMLLPGEKVMIQFPHTGPSCLADLIDQAVTKIGAESIPFSKEKSFGKQCVQLKEKRPDCYIGPPVFLLSLMRVYNYLYPEDTFPITRALISGDACPQNVITALESSLHTKLFPHYGSRECGLGGAITCPAHKGMHIRENHMIAEIIDSDLHPVSPGIWGELVITTIGLAAMPLIRYRTGDYTRILPDPCPCGSVTKRLDHISRIIGSDDFPLSMEILDNCLFTVPKLVDCQAAFTPEDDTLKIDALVLDNSCKESLENSLNIIFSPELLSTQGFLSARNSLPDRIQIHLRTTLYRPGSVPFHHGKRVIFHT